MSPSPGRFAARLLLAALLVAGPVGCALWDDSQVPRISPGGTIRTRGMTKVRVDCAGASEGEFLLDGQAYGKRFRVGAEIHSDFERRRGRQPSARSARVRRHVGAS